MRDEALYVGYLSSRRPFPECDERFPLPMASSLIASTIRGVGEHAAIPDGVDERSAGLLRRAYDLSDTDTGQQLYREWADTYDRTMLDGLGYRSPAVVADAFARHAPDRVAADDPVLDLGCGTGLLGAELAARNYRTLDGLDLSAAMMDVAARSGRYRHLIEADLTAPLPIDDQTYTAAVSCGTFTSGHVGAGCLPEVVRILSVGGLLVCTVHHAVWSNLGFDTAFADLTSDGTLLCLEQVEVGFYDTTTDDGLLCVYLRTR